MSAHKSFLKRSDFLLLVFILLATGLELYIPTDLQMQKTVSVAIGTILFVVALLVIARAKKDFKKHKQNTGPGKETTVLIQDGVFKYSRNPLYLMVVIMAPALGFLFDNMWLIMAVVPLLLSLNYFFVIPEERYLEEKFGDEYGEYRKNTRKWL